MKLNTQQRPFRSTLYLPASNKRALEKAKNLPCDSLIFDLEDAVAIDCKALAREQLSTALTPKAYGARTILIRVNGLNTPWGAADLQETCALKPDGIVIPKTETKSQMDAYADKACDTPLWAMIETPLGVINAHHIASHPQINGLILGTNDLQKDLRAEFQKDRLPLMQALQTTLLAARAHNCIALDGVYNAFRDEAGLQDECEQGKALGFDGKTLIHPSQIAIANKIFSPSESDLQRARGQIHAFQEAQARGEGVAVFEGEIVEGLHIEAARALLNKAEMIKKNASVL